MDDGKNITRYLGEDENSTTTDGINGTVTVALKAVSIVIIFLITCGLNFIVAYTLYKKSYLQNTGNKFVFTLAVSNFVYGAVVLPFNFISCVTGDWIFGITMCNISGFITMTVFGGSMLSIVIITMDRYYAILQPMLYPGKFPSRRTKELIAAIWVLSLSASLPPLFGWSQYTWLPTTSNCLVQWDNNPSFTYTFTAVFLLIPLCILCYCYWKILRVARLTTRRTSNGNTVLPTPEYDPSVRRRSRRSSLLVNIRMNSPTKAIKTVLVTLTALLLTVGPLTVMIVFQAINGAEKVPVIVEIITTWFFFCNFIANSLIYAVWNKSIRRELSSYLCVRGRCMEDDDTLLCQPIRRSSKAISISESISDRKSSLKQKNLLSDGIQKSTNDESNSGTTLTCIEESKDAESLCLTETGRKTPWRRHTSGSIPRYVIKDEIRFSLPVVAEVDLSCEACEEENSDDDERT